ncbi:alpha/beta hydrolase [Actibacterium ureilyticum]|uniref:alpha/beta hydrolase n=1 Tax=Actibacterium ureilyticum TaxID=1590614 RepID=UPI000BAB0E4D|nr:alpha/beta hydrolase [Actibacterium ureilyticum]
MSWRQAALNNWLRRTERPQLARGTPEELRRNLAIKSRLFFHPPLFSRIRRDAAGGVPGLSVRGPGAKGAARILYLHGGGYVFGSARTHSAMVAHLSKRCGLPAFLPDYRLAPDHPFPAAVDDALAAYRALADQPGGVVIGGDSAGGGLALVLLAEILRLGLPKPLGVFAFSPLTDLTFSGDSFYLNAESDVVLPAERAGEMAQMYLSGAYAEDPRVSPLYADFTGGPPVWLTAADTEVLLDDTTRMTSHLNFHGVPVTEIIETDLPHVWPFFHGILPQAGATLDAVAAWIRPLAASR